MNCLGWNCKGVGNPRTVRALNDLVRGHKPDVLFLSETISNADRIEKLRIKFGYGQCFSIDKVGRNGGLAVFWKSTVDCSITGYSQNHIDVVFNNNNVADWRLTCYYGFPERSRRKEAWDMIVDYQEFRISHGVSWGILTICFIIQIRKAIFLIRGLLWKVFGEP